MQITITNLHKKYGAFHAIKGMNLTIQQGMFGLLGPNGAGKTTLMQMLATLEPVTEGSVVYSTSAADHAVSHMHIGEQHNRYALGKDDQSIRSILGYLPQEFGLYKKLSGYEYLDYVAMMKGITDKRQRKEEVHDLLEKVNLTEHAKKRVGSYSGGMKQRVGIAQALLGSPRVIIVDEPTAGLDPEERIRFRDLLSELSTERIVILSTHIVADIESSCSQLAIMKRGQLVFQGTQDSLLDLVKDQVWTGVIDGSQAAALKGQVKVISSRAIPSGQEIRVLCESQPFSGAELARPGIEDAYIAVMEADKADMTAEAAQAAAGHKRGIIG